MPGFECIRQQFRTENCKWDPSYINLDVGDFAQTFEDAHAVALLRGFLHVPVAWFICQLFMHTDLCTDKLINGYTCWARKSLDRKRGKYLDPYISKQQEKTDVDKEKRDKHKMKHMLDGHG